MIATTPGAPALDAIRAAAARLAPYIVTSPLHRFAPGGPSGAILLKLENLQAIGAFKARPAGNVLLGTGGDRLQEGVYTASSGNAGLGLAWMSRQLKLDARIYAPASAPREKIAAIVAQGADVRTVSDEEWWRIIVQCGHPADRGLYVDAVRDPLALAGNGTVGLEIAGQCRDVDTVVFPFGGGGLSCGSAAALRALKPDTRIIIAESDTAAPVTAALEAGRPVDVETRQSFISGAGAPTVLDEMWPLVSQYVDDTIVVSPAQVADAVRLLFLHSKVIAEGAGALALAAALAGGERLGKTVCVVSGGNIDADVMATILQGGQP
jgi:threonine dehydratase